MLCLQAFSRNLLSKLLTVIAVASALVFTTAFAYSKVTDKRLSESMFRTYTVLQNTPGAAAHLLGCHERTACSLAASDPNSRKSSLMRDIPNRMWARLYAPSVPACAAALDRAPHRHITRRSSAGADACNETTHPAAWVVNLTHLLGLFSYALLLGIVSDDVQRTVEAFKNGNTAVFERGHTVVLNVNTTTENLLRQVHAYAGCRCDCRPRAEGGDV